MIVKELFAKLGLDVDMSGFEKANTLMGGLKAGTVVLGGLLSAAAAGATALVMHTAEVAGEARKMAQMTGLTTDAVQELGYAAKRSGLDAEEMGHGLIHLARHMQSAKDGSDEQAKAFNKVGVSVVGADGHLRNADEVLEALAEKFKAMPDGAEKTALSMQLFGRSGAMMIPMLNKGRDGIEELRKSARDMGMVLDTETIQASAKFRGAMSDLKMNTEALRLSIGASLMPTVLVYVRALSDWVRANRDLTRQRIEKVMGLVTVALKLVLVPAKALLAVLGGLVDNWKLIAVILGSVVLAALVVNAGAVWAAVAANVSLGAASVAAALKSAAAWAAANWPLLLLTAIFVGIILLMDDIAAALRGDNSAMKEWLGNWKDDNANDPWWLRDLKSLAYLMLNFGPIFDFWKGEFAKLWQWVKDSAADTWGDIVHGVKKLFGISDPEWDKKQRDKSRLAMGYNKDMSGTLGAGEWRTNSLGERMWYPFADPSEAAQQGWDAHVKNGGSTKIDVVQHINGGPNATPKDIANESADKLQTVFEEAHQEM